MSEDDALAASEVWTVGDITVTKVVELEGWNTIDEWAETMPGCTPAAIDDVSWLAPTYRRGDTINMSIHTMIVETGDRTLLIDLGLGNAKQRRWSVANRLHTGFLDRIGDVVPLDEVDTVVFTHLHTDHVGGATTRSDGRWVPTFPNARYCLARPEHDYWQAYAREAAVRETYDEYARMLMDGAAVYDDSIAPLTDAGLVDWVQPGTAIAPGVSLLATPGHTPGHLSVLIESGTDRAVISGDVFHSPAQVAHPEWTVLMDGVPDQARTTRETFLATYADTDTVVLGSHFGTPTGCRVVRAGSGFRLEPVRGAGR